MWLTGLPGSGKTTSAQYLQDAAVGNAGAITHRTVTHTPARISKEAHIGYLADMDQQWRHDRINKLRSAAQQRMHTDHALEEN